MKHCNFSSDAVNVVLSSLGGNTEPQANYQRKQVSNSVRNLFHISGTSNKYCAGEFLLATCFLGKNYMEKEKKKKEKADQYHLLGGMVEVGKGVYKQLGGLFVFFF